jgi:hypothetical protein
VILQVRQVKKNKKRKKKRTKRLVCSVQMCECSNHKGTIVSLFETVIIFLLLIEQIFSVIGKCLKLL